MPQWIALLDFESVLVPELWPVLGDALGCPELLLTTRQVSDKIELNKIRLAALKKKKVTVTHIEKILETLEPLPGAEDFLHWLGAQMPFVIVSDCFRPMALPLLKKLGMPAMIAHEWCVRQGRVVGLPLRSISLALCADNASRLRGRRASRRDASMVSPGFQPRASRHADSKSPVVRSFQKLGFNVFATGDSLNDLGMLRAADDARWFCPSPRALILAPQVKVCQSYAGLKKAIARLK